METVWDFNPTPAEQVSLGLTRITREEYEAEVVADSDRAISLYCLFGMRGDAERMAHYRALVDDPDEIDYGVDYTDVG